MNHELPHPRRPTPPAAPRPSLEQRLAQRPAVLERLHQITDMLEQSVGDDSTADDAETRVTLQLRQLGQELLTQWAHEASTHTDAGVPQCYPGAIRHGKKNS